MRSPPLLLATVISGFVGLTMTFGSPTTVVTTSGVWRHDRRPDQVVMIGAVTQLCPRVPRPAAAENWGRGAGRWSSWR